MLFLFSKIHLINKESTEDPFYSSTNMERLKKAMKDAEEGKFTQHELIEEKED